MLGVHPSGERRVAVVLGQHFTVAKGGECHALGEFRLRDQPELYTDVVFPGQTQPMMLRRDVETWSWKGGTDLVVQGSVRFERPQTSVAVELRCQGPTSFVQTIAVTGDRFVQRSGAGLRLSDPEPFVEMPLRWDKAYGGTDELAERELLDPEYRKFLAEQLDERSLHAWSEYSYPRNPAGKGYLILEQGAEGLAWPNLEFPHDRLSLARLLAPRERWGSRPYPACWDLLPYHWFPRSAAIINPIATADGRMPALEVERGLVPERLPELERVEQRPTWLLARSAHPLLQHHRLAGSERLTLTSMAPEGGDLEVQLPKLQPEVRVRLNGGRARSKLSQAVLDSVFVDAEERTLRLIWRAELADTPYAMRADWAAHTEVEISWGWVRR